jgi:outer membrane lipoprotein carrier protein
MPRRVAIAISAALLIAIVLTLPFRTSASTLEAAVKSLEQRYHHAGTLKATFFESYTDGHGSSSAESGTVYFSRPGRMRWDYESPEPKLFLVDGANVWFYVPADHTASRAKLSQSSDWRTPLALLAGKADLSKLCRTIEPAGAPAQGLTSAQAPAQAPPDTVLRCIPRASPESETIRDVLFEINSDGFLTRVLIREAGNAATEFRFGNWRENITVPEAQFHFAPPQGVAVVDESSLAATIH